MIKIFFLAKEFIVFVNKNYLEIKVWILLAKYARIKKIKLRIQLTFLLYPVEDFLKRLETATRSLKVFLYRFSFSQLYIAFSKRKRT